MKKLIIDTPTGVVNSTIEVDGKKTDLLLFDDATKIELFNSVKDATISGRIEVVSTLEKSIVIKRRNGVIYEILFVKTKEVGEPITANSFDLIEVDEDDNLIIKLVTK